MCVSCGRDNPEDARFCNGCGAALATAAPPREVRKTVTVLFCDVTGSTALGESTDPEALRELLARYFDRMKAIVESHGGTLEKFIATDNPWLQGWACEDLAAVLERSGRIDDARAALERALAVWERKHCLPYVDRLREQIDLLGRAEV
jgi:class 3 adenylate cyclase